MIVQFDCDWDIDNQVRMLHRTLKGAVTLRALREALWRIGLERPSDEVLARAKACERVMGRPRIEPQFTTVGTAHANAKIAPETPGQSYARRARESIARRKLQQGKKQI